MGNTRTIVIKESNRRKIELAVNPDECSIADTVNHTKTTIDQLGEVLLTGKRGLKSVTINTFLPDRKSPFYDGADIDEIIKLVERWKKIGATLRIIFSKPKFNIRVKMNSDSLTLKEGQRDVYIDWKFTEYKNISVPTVESIQGLINVTDPALLPRTEEAAPVTGGEEVVKSGTTLWALAVKYYGDGSQWTKISAANGNIDPKKLQEGMTLTIP